MRDFAKLGKKIIVVGYNYKSHLKELGLHPPSAPFFYLKPTTSYVEAPNPIKAPSGVEIEHQLEFGVVIGELGGRNIPIETAMNSVAGFCVAINLVANQLRLQSSTSGLPWSISVGFDTFCPVSFFVPKSGIKDPHDLDIWLKINQNLRQETNTSEMITNIPTLVSEISKIMKLERGDLILTGTPNGVGTLKQGDIVTAGIGYDFVQTLFRVVPGPKGREK